MKIFKELKKLGYKHYTENTVEELDDLPIDSEERIMEQTLVLRWFREKYKLELPIGKDDIGRYYFSVKKSKKLYDETDYCFESYEKAELECLKKLIEIVKNKNKIK
jgi:hypothetical protein